MKKITASILTTLLMLSMVFSSSVFAANEEVSAWDSFLGLFSGNATTTATDAVGVEYRGHIQNVGNFPLDGTWIQGPNQLGTVGQSLRLEGFWIRLSNQPENVNIQYRVHVQNEGWMTPVENGAFAGTEGKSQQIEAIEINLVDDEGNAVQGYSVQYKGHIQNQGDTAWFEDGQQLGTVGSFLRLEALEVKIVSEKADMAAYEAAVAEATALTEADYTAASWAALETALIDNLVTEDNTQAEVDAATAAINDAIDALVMVTKIDTVTATGVKTLTVNFNQAVTAEQQATAAVTVKKGSVTTNLDKTAFTEDGTGVVLTTSSKLTKGTYTVTAVVDGVTSTGTVDVVDEKVATIALTSDKAVQDGTTKSEAKVFYEVKNQYGEVMTGQTINWTISTGVAAKNDNNKSEFVITNAGTPAADFIPGSTVYITGVHAASGTVMNASVTVGLPAKADSVDFAGVYNLATKKIEALPAGFASGKYVLLYEAYDQYGHKLVPSAGQIVYTVDNPLFINSTLSAATPVLLNGVTYQSLALVPGTNPDIGGTANINAISTVTGTNSSYTITADSLSLVKTFTMSAPADLVVAGEKIEIPFEAFDQNGVAVTKYDQLKNKVSFTNPASTTLAFEKNADGTAKLVFEPATGYVTGTNTSAIASITSVVVNQGSFSALNLDVKAAAVPTVIIGLDPEVSTTVAKGQTFNLYVEDLMIQDQYGRLMTDAKVTTAAPIVSYKTTDMSGTQATNPSATAVAFKATGTKTAIAVANGSGTQTVSSLEFAIYKTSISNANVVAGSQKSFPVTVAAQSDYVSYEIAEPGLFYMDTTAGSEAGTAKDITVYGVKADGTKVVLAQDNFDVRSVQAATLTDKGIFAAYAASKWTIEADNYVAADFKDAQGVAKNVTAKVTVDIKDSVATGTIKATITKDVTISNAAPTGTTITMKDKGFGGKYNIPVGTTTVNAAFTGLAISEVKDQYGVAMSAASTATISNVTLATGSAFAFDGTDITGAVVGDTFTANFTYGTTVYTAEYLVNDTDANNTIQLDLNTVNADKNALALEVATPTAATSTIALPATGTNGSTIAWKIKTQTSTAIAGNVNDVLTTSVTTEARAAGAKVTVITATITKGAQSVTKDFTITVPAGVGGTDAITAV